MELVSTCVVLHCQFKSYFVCVFLFAYTLCLRFLHVYGLRRYIWGFVCFITFLFGFNMLFTLDFSQVLFEFICNWPDLKHLFMQIFEICYKHLIGISNTIFANTDVKCWGSFAEKYTKLHSINKFPFILYF